MKEYRFVGLHADELDGGRPLAPGEYTGPISSTSPKNKSMIADGTLYPVEDGTAEKVEAINTAATAKMENSGEHLTTEEWRDAEASIAIAHPEDKTKKKGDSA